MEATNAKAYLLIARFNYEKWKELTDEEHDMAEETAEEMFPERPNPLPQYDPNAQDTLPHMKGVREVHTFASDVYARLPEGYSMRSREEKIAILEPIYATQRPKPPVGWMVVVDADHVARFLDMMGYHEGFLWRMFDIEILPLKDGWTTDDVYGRVPAVNDDKTTNDIYSSMTIRNWN